MIKCHYFFFVFILIFINSCKPITDNVNPKTTFIRSINPVKEVVMENLKRPWSMAFLSPVEALIAEKDGDLLRVDLKNKTRQRIAGFPDDLADSLLIDPVQYPKGVYPGTKLFKGKYNAGIFEVLLDPDFSTNNQIYISYSSEKDKKFTTKVISAKLLKDSLVDVKTLLLALPYSDGLFHFGGGMVIGHDKKLYISVGSRLFGDNLEPSIPIAQDFKDQRGKIYRINTDGSIPDDNPDFGQDAVPGIYAAGIRATQGLTIDPQSGSIWFSEHGTNQGDELNKLTSGANYGWPIISTGTFRYGYEPPKMDREFAAPMWSWYKTIAPTGLTFYSGTEFPQWKNNLIVPGLSRGNFWRLVIEEDEILSVEELFINDRHRTRKVVQSPNGELYILTDEENGKIIRIKNKE